jgi:hypothetical protein
LRTKNKLKLQKKDVDISKNRYSIHLGKYGNRHMYNVKKVRKK